MAHQLYFRVGLGSSPSPYPFRASFLTVTVQTNGSPVVQLESDQNGFLIWKSLTNRDNAATVYQHLLAEPELTTVSFSFATEGFAFVFFDLEKQKLAFGKDRLGLCSLISSREPLAVASHDLEGEEHPPGFTIATLDGFIDVPMPSYQKGDPDLTITVDGAVDRLTTILVRNVLVGFPVMFSGGIDSTLVAAACALAGAAEVVLLNFVAHESAPDRAAARASCADLRVAFPRTVFDLREYTGNVDEMSVKLGEIRSLLTPMTVTEMNLNIAMTLYSALIHSNTYAAHSGLGADELFCGYMRMRSETTVQGEVSEHMSRIWLRNGGRDDRVSLHLGKQCICPYLCAEFIDMAMTLPAQMLIRPDLPRGEGEKWILRQIALRYGLRSAAARPKQAMQFGSKVAKVKWRGSKNIPES
jgi:asparagine synthetase B (glutamine-hydrolysing)